MDEAGLLAIAAAGAGLTYWLARKAVKRFAPVRVTPAPLRYRHMLVPALALPLLLAGAARMADPRFALARFTAPWLAVSALEGASDVDHDGYGWFGARVDRFPFDPARHPLALDVPGNGIDEDGYGGDLIFAAPPPAVPARLPGRPDHLVLIVLESARADAIGRRFGGREVTPNLNRLARSGSSSREAYSHVGFTTASLKSLFAGSLDPAPGAPSLFRDLKWAGYRIGIFSGQPESFGDISEVVGMRAAADVFVDAEMLKDERAFGFAAQGSLLVDGRKLLREFDRHFARPADWARPNFAYFNFQEAHFPYAHPATMCILPGLPIARADISAANRAALERTYWNAIAYDDWLVGQVLARLDRLGVREQTLVAVTSDHGESLFDDGFLGHGHMINSQQTQIPFIIGRPGLVPAGPIGLADMRAILRAALGATTPAPRGIVFQHIGPLSDPAALGMVGPGGARTLVTMEDEMVSFSGRERAIALKALPPGSRDARQAKQLLDLWARERWIAHAARRRNQVAVRP